MVIAVTVQISFHQCLLLVIGNTVIIANGTPSHASK